MDDSPTIARACMLLVVLVNEIRGLRADLAGRRAAPRSITPDDMATLTDLLPRIHTLTAGANFTVHGMMLRDDAALREILAQHGIDDNARRLGRLLRRAACADAEVSGLYVHAVGKVRDGVSFCVSADTRETRLASGLVAKSRVKMTV